MDPKELPSSLAALAAAPGRLFGLTHGLDRGVQTFKPSPGDFSILESVWHLRDIEAEGYLLRIRWILAETEPLLPDVKGDVLAVERRYNDLDLDQGVEGFRSARMTSVGALERSAAPNLARTGLLETVGVITLGELIEMMLEHDRSHLQEVEWLKERQAAALNGPSKD